ncbi:MAG: PIN domain-containing protein, partial [bacterium]
MIEDTSFIIDLLRNNEGAVDILSQIEKQRIAQKCSSVTVLELFEGIYQFDEIKSEHAEVLDVLRSKHIVSADADLMEEAGKISGTLLRNGRQIDREDCVIAATARRENEPVITRNADHFRRVPEVSVETY